MEEPEDELKPPLEPALLRSIEWELEKQLAPIRSTTTHATPRGLSGSDWVEKRWTGSRGIRTYDLTNKQIF